MKNFIIKRRNPIFVAFSIIFWLVFLSVVVLVVAYNIVSKMNHEKKWSDYDDCGIF